MAEISVLLLIVTQNPGGVEKRFYNYSKYLSNKKEGRNTIIISRSLISSLGDFTAKYNNRVIKYGVKWKSKNVLTRYIDYFFLIPILISLFPRNFDAIHFVTLSALFFRNLIRSKCKVFSLVTSIRKEQEKFLSSKICKKLMENNYMVDCLDSNIRNITIAYFPDKKSNIFCAPCSFIDYDGTKYHHEEKKNLICFAGRLEEFKGIQLLSEILEQIVISTNYSIKIFGKGGYEKIILDKINENKLFGRVCLGYTLNLKEELIKSKIFLSLQQEENYPSQSLIEAMACGNAIIATNVGLTKQIVKEDFGILISNSSKELLDAIIKLTSPEIKLSDIGRKASVFAKSEHSVDNFYLYLMNLYKINI